MASHHHSEASTMIGVSSATLRRLARGYEAVFGELPTDGAGGRLYPDHALDLITEARELVKARRVGTLEQAFKVLADGEDLALPAPTGLEPILAELSAIRLAMERQAVELQELKGQLQALPSSQPTKAARSWWRLWGRSPRS
jgi:hypothetical protein